MNLRHIEMEDIENNPFLYTESFPVDCNLLTVEFKEKKMYRILNYKISK